MGVSCVVVPSHRRIGNIGRNPGRYTGNPCSRLGPLRRHSRGCSFDHPATSGVFPSRTDRLLCCLAPDGESDFLKDRWLPGTWGSCRSACNEGERVPLGVNRRIARIFLDAAHNDLERPQIRTKLAFFYKLAVKALRTTFVYLFSATANIRSQAASPRRPTLRPPHRRACRNGAAPRCGSTLRSKSRIQMTRVQGRRRGSRPGGARDRF